MLNIAILGALWSQIIAIGLTVLLLLIITAYNYKDRLYWKILGSRMIFAFMPSLLLLLSMVIKGDYVLLYLTIIIIFFEVAILSMLASVAEFAKSFVIVVFFLAAYSLIVNYVARSAVFAYLPDCMDFINTSGYHFMNLIFSNMMDLSYYFRNYGIFREPGQYAFIILIALASNLFVLKKNKYRLVISIVLILSMLSTFSPTGVVSMALLLLAYIIYSSKEFFSQSHALRKLVIPTVSIFIIMSGVSIFVLSNENLSATFTTSATKVFDPKSESSNARSDAVLADVKMIIDSPLVGNKSVNVFKETKDNTFTPGIILAIFGLIVGSVIYALWWSFTVDIIGKKHFVVIMIVSTSIFIGVSTQNVVTEMFFYILPLMAYYDKSDEATPIINYIKSKIAKRRFI